MAWIDDITCDDRNIWWSKSRCVWDFGIGIADIMCVDVTREYLHLASMAGMDDITCDNLTYDDPNLDVCEIVVLELMI